MTLKRSLLVGTILQFQVFIKHSLLRHPSAEPASSLLLLGLKILGRSRILYMKHVLYELLCTSRLIAMMYNYKPIPSSSCHVDQDSIVWHNHSLVMSCVVCTSHNWSYEDKKKKKKGRNRPFFLILSFPSQLVTPPVHFFSPLLGMHGKTFRYYKGSL